MKPSGLDHLTASNFHPHNPEPGAEGSVSDSFESNVAPWVKPGSTTETTIMATPVTQPQTAQIKCVKKRDRPNPHERITHVGGYGANQWKLTQEEAISMIINGFCKDVFVHLPMEFAVEATKLLGLKLEGSVG